VTWNPASGWSTDITALPAAPGASVALAFADPKADVFAVLEQVQQDLPGTVVMGCSTAGQILGARIDPSPLVMDVVSFDHAKVVSAYAEERGAGSHDLGVDLGRELVASAGNNHLAGVMVFGGGLETNGSDLVDGLAAALPPGTAMSGGLAGDDDRFEATWVYHNGQHSQDCVAAFAVLGESVSFHHGSQGGWDGFGPLRTITRSVGNVLYELDGQPALALYKQYLGDRAEDLPGSALLFPLTVASPDGSAKLVRTILSVDEDEQSMTFAGNVPQGWSARLMWTTVENLMEGASEAATDAAADSVGLAVAISCVGRRLVLGQRTDEEIESVLEALGEHIPLIGFYSYGEISSAGGMCQLHNQTMTITTIHES
jgi:hypothetical protein